MSKKPPCGETYANEGVAAANSKAAGSMAMAAETQKRAASLRARAAEAELKLEELRNRIAPRSLTQNQQHDLTAKLLGFENVNGTVIASPTTPESEWFARVLTAPLKEAEWEITILPGTAEATILQPQGVVIQYPLEQHVVSLGMPNPGPSASLAEALNELGIEATAIPGMVPAPNNIAITISAK